MLHTIKPEEHGPLGSAMAEAVQACVHCGFCLSACPTYQEFGQEMDSPRGRIVLMKQVLEGSLPASAAQTHVDRCLGCLACEPACPSGVPYRDLISPFRAEMEERGEFSRGMGAKLRRWLASKTLPYPARMRLALAAAKAGRMAGALVPAALRPMVELAPREVTAEVTLPRVTPAQGQRRARVALLAGCAQQVLDPDINVATIEVLARNGVEVIVPEEQGCCGGLAWHTGDLRAAREFARRNLAAFPSDVDAIVTNAAGCGSAMHEYHLILRGAADETGSTNSLQARAEEFRRRVVDVSVFLARLGLREAPSGWGERRKIAYHDACHLANAQGVRDEPRSLLRSIPGVELLELPNAHLCCGSAGTYNLDQPETAASLGAQKARAVIETLSADSASSPQAGSGQAGAAVVASGNIGCLTQLRAHLEKLGANVRARHTMQVLRDAYRA